MEIKFLRNWKHAYRGIHVVEYVAGETHDLDEDVCEKAIADGAGKLKAGLLKASSKKSGSAKPAQSSQADQASKKSKLNTSKTKSKS